MTSGKITSGQMSSGKCLPGKFLLVKCHRTVSNKYQELSRKKEHFEQHLNVGSKRNQPPNQINLSDDGVEIEKGTEKPH
jgi:hypothetical protein